MNFSSFIKIISHYWMNETKNCSNIIVRMLKSIIITPESLHLSKDGGGRLQHHKSRSLETLSLLVNNLSVQSQFVGPETSSFARLNFQSMEIFSSQIINFPCHITSAEKSIFHYLVISAKNRANELVADPVSGDNTV